MEKQGDARITGSFSYSGLDGQLAYAITNHIGLMCNGSVIGKYGGTFGEFGIGYFGLFGTLGKYELYGGAGYGTINLASNNDEDNYYSVHKVENYRLFLQPSIALSGKVADLSFSPRLVHVSISGSNFFKSSFFLEPTLTLKVGYKYVKFISQVGLSFNLDRNSYIDYQPIIMAIGVQIALENIFTKKNN